MDARSNHRRRLRVTKLFEAAGLSLALGLLQTQRADAKELPASTEGAQS